MKIPVVEITRGSLYNLYLQDNVTHDLKMNLVIDGGNTQIKWAIYSGEELIIKHSISGWDQIHPENISKNYPEVNSVIISSVRSLPEDIIRSFHNFFPRIIEFSLSLKLPITIKYKTPDTLGKDRIAAVVGGAAKFPGACVLIIDMGTAITLDLVNEKAEFLGGNISPGMLLRFKSLGQFTADLPTVNPSKNTPFLGQTTSEALQAGVQQGIIYELEGYINTLKNKYNGLRVILTGGDASFFVQNLKNTIFVIPNLVLDGLNLILEYQTGKN